MSVTQDEMDEMRRDCIAQDREDEQHECKMRTDYEYFFENSVAQEIVELREELIKACDKYDQDFKEIWSMI